MHAYTSGAPLGDLIVALAWSSLFRRQTREKEEENDIKRNSSARDEGSSKGEWITRVVTSVSRRRASRKCRLASRNNHARVASTLYAALRAEMGKMTRRADKKRTMFSALGRFTDLRLQIRAACASQQRRSLLNERAESRASENEFQRVYVQTKKHFIQSNPDANTSATNEKSACAHVKNEEIK